MKMPDWLIGLALIALSLAVLWHVQTFPEIPGQQYGAALFPGLVAAGLGLAALVLTVGSLIRRGQPAPLRSDPLGELEHDAEAEAAREEDDAGPMTGRRWLALALSVASVVFYIVAAESLGFIPTGIIILAVMMGVYGTRPALIVPVALVATLLIHTGFYKLLRVPLPWGVLQPFAW